MTLREEIIATLIERYGISEKEAKYRLRIAQIVDEIGFEVSQRRKKGSGK